MALCDVQYKIYEGFINWQTTIWIEMQKRVSADKYMK